MSLEPLICTVDVENASDVVTISDATVLTDLNCRKPAHVSIAGVSYSVAERLTTLTFRISRTYAGVDAEDVSCEIAPFTPEMANRTALSKQLIDYSAKLALLHSQGNGLFYNLLGVTGANDPGPGFVAVNNADWSLVTEAYFDVLDVPGKNRTPIIDLWGVGTEVVLQSVETGAYAVYALTATPTNQGPDAWRKIIGLEFIGKDGVLADGEALTILYVKNGSGLEYDVRVADLAARVAYDDEATGYSVFVEDIGDGRSAIYAKLSATSEDWSGPAYFTGPVGPQGDEGWTPVHDLVTDGLRLVNKLVGYTGGAGTAPTVNIGKYQATAGGYTNVIADAMNVRSVTPGPNGEPAHVYVAYADADDGTNFALVPGSRTYVAVLSSATTIASPAVGDFAGLWQRVVGQGLQLPTSIAEDNTERDGTYGEGTIGDQVLVLNSTDEALEADWIPAIYILLTPDDTTPVWAGPINIGGGGGSLSLGQSILINAILN